MRHRIIFGRAVTVLGLIALAATAQPKKNKAGKQADEAPATDMGAEKDSAEKKPADKSVDSAEAEPGDDLGERPPPRAEQVDEDKKPSPLTPRPDEFPDGGVQPPSTDYDKLLAEVAALRARVAALTSAMFKSKLRVFVRTDGDDARIDSLVVTLDDGVVFTAPDRFTAPEERVVYEHAVAPGHHVIGVEVERHDSRGQQYRTWQSSKFSVVVPEGQWLEADLRLEDDSDIAEDFPDDQDGEYELKVRLRARVTEE